MQIERSVEGQWSVVSGSKRIDCPDLASATRTANALIIGSIDKLGYLYCAECRPVDDVTIWSAAGQPTPQERGDVIYSDSCYAGEECELCHKPV